MTQYSFQQVADALGLLKRNVERRAKRESWPFTETPVRGGMQKLFSLADLPDDVKKALKNHNNLFVRIATREMAALKLKGWPKDLKWCKSRLDKGVFAFEEIPSKGRNGHTRNYLITGDLAKQIIAARLKPKRQAHKKNTKVKRKKCKKASLIMRIMAWLLRPVVREIMRGERLL